jgi:hypothetical protein
MNNKFFTPTSARVSSRLNKYMKENFGYEVEGDLKELRAAKARLQEMANSGEGNYVETSLMLQTVDALIKAHSENLGEGWGKKKVKEGGKPDFLDIDKDGDKKEPMKKAAKDAKKIKESSCGCCGNTPCDCGPKCDCKSKSLEESLLADLNALLENDTASAEITMAARGIVDELQDVIEKLGKIQNDQLGPLVDEMTYTHGGDQAQSFHSSVDSAIGGLLDQTRQAKETVNNAVLVLTGEAPATDTMAPSGDELGGDMTSDFEGDIEADTGDDMEADFGAGDEANTGPVDEPLGRARR